jgi:hypothetical protein
MSPLQERRIDRNDRLQPPARESSRERHSVLFRDPDIEKALGKFFLKLRQAGPGWHGRRDRNHLGIPAGMFGNRIGKSLGVRHPTTFSRATQSSPVFTSKGPTHVLFLVLFATHSLSLFFENMKKLHVLRASIRKVSQTHDIVPVHRPEIPNPSSSKGSRAQKMLHASRDTLRIS